MKSRSTRQGEARKLSKIFRQLRLLATRVILCYGSNRTGLREDIDRADHVCELSEEYAFRALSLWLVTTYGSSVCNEAIRSDLDDAAEVVAAVFSKFNEYPFANIVPDRSFNEFNEQAKTLLNGCSPQIELLGSLYEHIHKFPLYIDVDGEFDIPTHIQEKDKRRLVGQFYTPASIVDYCFERATDSPEDKLISALKSICNLSAERHEQLDLPATKNAPRILDPSCGTGNFLLGAIRLIRKHCQQVDAEKILGLIGSCLFGFELDGRAASLTRLSLVIAVMDTWLSSPNQKSSSKDRCVQPLLSNKNRCLEPQSVLTMLLEQLRTNIQNVDTLYAAPWHQEIGEHKQEPKQEHNYSQQFTLVITNPPYVSFGARNQSKMSDSATTYLRTKFPNSAEYKIRVHSIFQEIALRYAEIGGTATLLIPDGFLTGGYYKQLRRMLLTQAQLHSFAELPVDTVPGAIVGRWCVATYKRSSSANASDDYSVDLYSKVEATPQQFTVPKSILVSRDQNRFRLVFNDIDVRLAELMDRSEPLGTEFRGHTGIRALHGQSTIVSDTRRGKNWQRGIVSGISVVPHVVTWNGAWLNIDPKLLYKGGYDPRFIENPKILIRQTGDCLIAAYDPDGFYHLNNVHSLTPISSGPSPTPTLSPSHSLSPISSNPSPSPSLGHSASPSPSTSTSTSSASTRNLHFIDGLLNSSFWLYIYRLKTREQGRALAQIDIETLESMPLPAADAIIEAQISALTKLYRRAVAASDVDLCPQIRRAIDKLVYDIYVLDEVTVKQIEAACGKLSDNAVVLPTADELQTLYALAATEEVVCALHSH